MKKDCEGFIMGAWFVVGFLILSGPLIFLILLTAPFPENVDSEKLAIGYLIFQTVIAVTFFSWIDKH